jgi:uncharacterized membrane protein
MTLPSSQSRLDVITKNRVESVDLLKGIVMVVMALDHTRDYFHQSSTLALTDPSLTTWPVYITRWISHFCAPTFCFLAGVSAYMVGKRKTKADLSGFLLKRGVWLILVEMMLAFVWYFDIHFNNFDLAVISMLGMSMISLAVLIHLPNKNLILLFSCLLIAFHNLLDNVHFENNILWSILHEYGSFKLPGFTLNVVYPIVPWIGVMSLGYYVGQFYNQPTSAQRKKLFNTIGIFAFVLFVVVRSINIYGDLHTWKSYEDAGHTIMSFMNVTKYPPSLLYLMVTLGGAFIFLANSEKLKGRTVNFFCVFGRVPFFYYILHLCLIRVLAAVAAEFTGYGWQLMIQTSFDIDKKDFGFRLPIVYVIWICIVMILYPLCKWFDRYKRSHKEQTWLSYL